MLRVNFVGEKGLIDRREKKANNYDDEVSALCEAATQSLFAELAPSKVVFFIDSHATISALSSNTPTDFLSIIQCRTKIVELISYDWIVTLQWVLSRHVEFPGNKRALSPTRYYVIVAKTFFKKPTLSRLERDPQAKDLLKELCLMV
ncbi:reverse transcriptase [Trichonephila clavipes]|nr:reverse transcriptase [Trichonephila clavipes]